MRARFYHESSRKLAGASRQDGRPASVCQRAPRPKPETTASLSSSSTRYVRFYGVVSIYATVCQLGLAEIAAALVAKTAPSAEGVALFELLSRSSMGEGLFEDACVPLRLCARVLGFCYGHPASQRATATQLPTPPRETWRELVEDLSSWYSNRPHPFQPMVEQEAQGANEEHDQLFPTILFTNGAAAFANQLYHTAMLLLLQHKPRTLALGPRRSAVMAPLWHAHRICGISLHNDRAGCWDPSLVASLYVAAKGMTYEPQHREILSALDRVAAATGWHIHRFQAMLQHAWGGDGS
ncbi:hypothetical protein VTK73DRAFT_1419 [Phialemonium thermophilum]|uniref:Uncharacterized protein n=1 Tax=Phialemonium thermophilum TaxID=223376 RepID=A0ABR3VTI0_9PEZI